MDLDLEIGTKIRVRGVLCEVVKSRKCSDCEVQKATSGRKSLEGVDMQCGKRRNGNTTDIACSKDIREDKTDVIFKRVQ
jgi:hypothetical protein